MVTEPTSAPAGSRRRRNLRRTIANLLIVAGVLALLYPIGTWGYARIEQAGLARRLAAEHPELEGLAEEFFQQKMTSTVPFSSTSSPGSGADVADGVSLPLDHDAARQAAGREERLQQSRALRAAALQFAPLVAESTGRPIGKLAIPKIGVNVVILEGTGTQDLREGPGHWPETPFPGLGGNFVVSGHRTTYGAPFFRLDQLEIGDEIQLALPYMVARYRVWRVIIVYPDETATVRQRGVEEISLATCHPIYSAEQRLVVQALLVDYQVLQADRTQEVGSEAWTIGSP